LEKEEISSHPNIQREGGRRSRVGEEWEWEWEWELEWEWEWEWGWCQEGGGCGGWCGHRETTSVSQWTGGTAGAGEEVKGCARSLQHHWMVLRVTSYGRQE